MDTKIPASSGRRIADLRERLGWTQRHLATEAGISVTFLSELENDKRSMGSDILLRIADALGASLDYILKGELQTPAVRRPLVIPPELEEAAEERGWSIGVTRDLLRAREIVVARRGGAATADAVHSTLTKRDWMDLYERLFGSAFTK